MPNRMTPEVATWVQRVMPSSSRAASRGEDKGVGRDKPLAGNTGQANTQHNRQRGAKRRSRGDAQGKRAGQRVIEDGLHFGAGQSQRQADDNRHHRIGQTDIPDDGARARIGAGRIG